MVKTTKKQEGDKQQILQFFLLLSVVLSLYKLARFIQKVYLFLVGGFWLG